MRTGFIPTLFPYRFSTGAHSKGEALESRLVVHEWGVMGVGQLTGGPAMGALEDYLESLPDFVERYQAPPAPLHIRQFPLNNPNGPTMIFKPVLHCYGAEGQEVSITITAAQGPLAVFYPRPKLSSDRAKNEPNILWTFVPETMTWELGRFFYSSMTMGSTPECDLMGCSEGSHRDWTRSRSRNGTPRSFSRIVANSGSIAE